MPSKHVLTTSKEEVITACPWRKSSRVGVRK